VKKKYQKPNAILKGSSEFIPVAVALAGALVTGTVVGKTVASVFGTDFSANNIPTLKSIY